MSLRRWLRERLAGYRWTSAYLRRVGEHNQGHLSLREPWPARDDLEARLLIAEGRLRHAQYEIQFLRSQLADLEREAAD